MGTRTSLRAAGIIAVLTAASLSASLLLFQGGPPTSNAPALIRWFTAESVAVQGASVLWLAAMLGLGVFAVTFREAMWPCVIDRAWTTLLFVEGAVVCATLAVVATVGTWSLALHASAGTIEPALALTIWELSDTLLMFATWGLAPALVIVAFALWRQSGLGQAAAVGGVMLAVALLAPLDRSGVLFGFAAWMALVGAALLVPTPSEVTQPVVADAFS